MERSASPQQMSPEPTTVRYTGTGRICKGKKGLKVHNCECGRTYTRADHLRRHQKNHAQDVLCDFPGCGKPFYRLDLLQRHQKRHLEAGDASVLPPFSANHTRPLSPLPEDKHTFDSFPTPLAPTSVFPPSWNHHPASGWTSMTDSLFRQDRDASKYFGAQSQTQLEIPNFFPPDSTQTVPQYRPQSTDHGPTQGRDFEGQQQSTFPSQRDIDIDSIPHATQSFIATADSIGNHINKLILPTSQSGDPFTKPGSLSMVERASVAFSDSGYGSVSRDIRKQNKLSSQADNADAFDDGRTEYTSASSAANSVTDSYLNELVEDLDKALSAAARAVSHPNIRMVYSALPSLLKSFARRLGTSGQDWKPREVMMFIIRYKETILAKLKNLMLSQDDASLHNTKFSETCLTLDAKIKRWMKQFNDGKDGETPLDFFDGVSDLPDELPEELLSRDLANYRDLVRGGPAYTWLLAELECCLAFAPVGTNHMQRISKVILDGLSREPHFRRISRHTSPPLCAMTFVIHWDPLVFLKNQEYPDSVTPEEALDGVITITGTGSDAQAMTTSQYMKQIWPTGGQETLDLIKDAVRSGYGFIHRRELHDETTLSVSITQNCLYICVTGIMDVVADIGEQIGWLGATLQSSPKEQGVVYCYPTVTSPVIESRGVLQATATCHINFDFELEAVSQEPVASALHTDGQCWQGLFRNPVVVAGYPIRNKVEQETGLEMPLEMIAALVGCNRLSIFAGKLFIKSFNRMLVLAKQVEDVLIWHFIFNEDGSYISYTDPRVRSISSPNATSIDISTLESSRHIVGWCAKVRSYAGRSEAQYDIGWSGLKRSHQKCAFEKVSISAGSVISGGISFAIGKRDKPAYITLQDDYVSKLEWISTHFVVLYDLEGKRAWLVDGLTALLHLVRASLHHGTNSKFATVLGRKALSLEEGETYDDAQLAAMAVLTNDANLNLKVHTKPEEQWKEETIKDGRGRETTAKSKKTHFSLKDRVLQIHHALEQIIAHQCNVDSEDGVGFRIKGTPRKQLEGFNFMDIATNTAPCWPLVTTIKETGRGWVDFTRAIHAITLFGRGFGDLLRPSDLTRPCSPWASVPKHRDCLAICCSDLETIFRQHGDQSHEPWRLVDDIYWVRGDKTFEHCTCSAGTMPAKETCDRVQHFLPSLSFTKKLWGKKLHSPSSFASHGAIILGHSSKLPLRWGAHNDPEEGEPESSDEEIPQSTNEAPPSQRHVTRCSLSSDTYSALNFLNSTDNSPSTDGTRRSSVTPSLGTNHPTSDDVSVNFLGADADTHASSAVSTSIPGRKRKREFFQDGIDWLLEKGKERKV